MPDTRLDRIQIDYTLEFTTPFHFGTGIRTGLIDRSVKRDPNGYLYVPGSSLKGVMRETCERLLHLYLPNNLNTNRPIIVSPHDATGDFQDFSGSFTPITRIFGSRIEPGRLRFDDAYQPDLTQYDGNDHRNSEHIGKYKRVQTSISTQVRIDRPTRTAVTEALYTSEFGVSGLTFAGHIRGWLECYPASFQQSTDLPDNTLVGTPTYSLLLLLAGLCMMERLGGNKSTGKGVCRCEITNVSILNMQQQPYATNIWESWLEQLEVLEQYPDFTLNQQ